MKKGHKSLISEVISFFRTHEYDISFTMTIEPYKSQSLTFEHIPYSVKNKEFISLSDNLFKTLSYYH